MLLQWLNCVFLVWFISSFELHQHRLVLRLYPVTWKLTLQQNNQKKNLSLQFEFIYRNNAHIINEKKIRINRLQQVYQKHGYEINLQQLAWHEPCKMRI
jgi:hypothetical protein